MKITWPSHRTRGCHEIKSAERIGVAPDAEERDVAPISRHPNAVLPPTSELIGEIGENSPVAIARGDRTAAALRKLKRFPRYAVGREISNPWDGNPDQVLEGGKF